MDNLIRIGGGSKGSIVFVKASSNRQNQAFATIESGLVDGKGCAIAYAGCNDGSSDRTLNSIEVQGSNDNSTWTDIGSTESATVPRSGGVANTNATFNDAAYKYYRVPGVASNVVSSAATLVVFK